MKRRDLTALGLAVTLFAAMPGLAQERTKGRAYRVPRPRARLCFGEPR